jgi:hypothetical protein
MVVLDDNVLSDIMNPAPSPEVAEGTTMFTVEETEAEIRSWLNPKIRTGRFSKLFVDQLVRHQIDRTVHVHAIYDQIGYLEGPDAGRGGAKDAALFTGKHLKGFWHQHRFEPRFMANNLANDSKSPEAMAIFVKMAEAINRGEEIGQFVHELVIGGYERRFREGKMTGEWIVFAKIEGVNHYLTLGKHDEGDDKILDRIKACATECPEIISLIPSSF